MLLKGVQQPEEGEASSTWSEEAVQVILFTAMQDPSVKWVFGNNDESLA